MNTMDLKGKDKLFIDEKKANSPWNKLKRNKTAMIGLFIVLAMTLLALLSPVFAPHDPNEMNLSKVHLKPGVEGHIFGTDDVGRDVLSRIIYGARISMIVAVGGTLVGGLIGVFLGLISGYSGGVVDSIIMRLMDAMFAFPFVLLAIVLMTVLGNGLRNVILAIGIANIPGYARITRGQVHVVKNEEYCNAARVLGASNKRLLLNHILPNILSPIIVYATLSIAGAIISEAALSFLGLGIAPPTASWGNILRSGKDFLNTYPHVATISGFFILITVLGFNLLGDGVRDVLDPKMKM